MTKTVDMLRTGTFVGRGILAGGLLFLSLVASAGTSTRVTVMVTLRTPPPCVINGGGNIEVNFGNVVIPDIDGNNYRQRMLYAVECGPEGRNAMKMQIVGTGWSVDSNALQTSKGNLGIALFNGDARLPLNSWLNFSYPNIPVLWAAPTKQGQLDEGAFTAAATMLLAYQ